MKGIGRWASDKWRLLDRNLVLLFFSTSIWGFGMFLFLPIQPLYIASLGAGPEQIGLVMGASGLLVTALFIPTGLWADRYGRKPVMLAGWCLGTIATLAMALAPDWRWLIPAMIAYLMSNFAMPAYRGYIAALRPEANLSWTFAILYSGSSVASIVAPAVGGWIGQQFGMRVIYLVASVLFALSAAVLLPLTAQPGAPHDAGTRSGHVLRRPGVGVQIIFVGVLFFALELGQVLLPKFLQDVRALSLSQIGFLGTMGTMGIVVWGLLFGRMPAGSTRPLLLSQFTALLAGLILIVFSQSALLHLAFFIYGSNFVVRPILQGRLAISLDPATLSLGYAFQEMAMRAGLALAPLAAGFLYANDPFYPLIAGVLALTLTLGLSLFLPAPTSFSSLRTSQS